VSQGTDTNTAVNSVGRVMHWACSLGVLAGALCVSCPSEAAGLYFSERGVRPMARAGAFIAGADDLGAIYHNPAGIHEAGGQFLLDASWLNFSSDYRRQAIVRQTDPNTGQTIGTFRQNFESVEGSTPVIPIPTLAMSFSPHDDWVLALGAYAPYAAIPSYPDEVNGQPAPQRYSLLTLEGSTLAFVGVWAAYAATDWLRLGAGLQLLVGSFRSSVVLQGCVPERFFCAPEDPLWDVLGEVDVGPIVAPTGNLGALFLLPEDFRIGTSFQFPTYVRSGATLKTRLPQAPVFATAETEGEDADVSFDLPWSLRFGIEARGLVEDLRVELAFVYDHWSMHDKITVEPDGVSLNNVVGFPRKYFISDIVFERNFQDSFGIRLGGEYRFEMLGYEWDARGGMAYESSAIPEEHLSVLTVDVPKWTLALGYALHIAEFRFDATFAHVFGVETVVDPETAQAFAVTPVTANAPRNPTAINGGIYDSRANIIGVGMTYTFDEPPQPLGRKKPVAEPESKPEEEDPAPAEVADDEAEAEPIEDADELADELRDAEDADEGEPEG